MCQVYSCIVNKQGRVWDDPKTHSHSRIIEKHKLYESNRERVMYLTFAKIEIVPPRLDSLPNYWENNLDKWEFVLDEQREPDWFTDKHRKACFAALKRWKEKYVLENQEIDKLSDIYGVYIRNCKIKTIRDCLISEIRENGSVGKIFENGSVGEIRKNGSVGEIWGNGSVGEIFGNGSVGEIFENGSVGEIFGNGSVGEIWENGSVGEIRENGSVGKIWGNGSVGEIFENGSVGKILENGSVGEMYNNATIISDKDGFCVILPGRKIKEFTKTE